MVAGRADAGKMKSEKGGLSPFKDETAEGEKHQRTDDGDAKRLHAELIDGAKAQRGSNPATNDGADNAKKDGHETTTLVFARHDEFGDGSSKEAENDPGKKAHICSD